MKLIIGTRKTNAFYKLEQSLDVDGVSVKKRGRNFNDYNIVVDQGRIRDYFRGSNFSPIKRNEPDLYNKIFVENNNFITKARIDSYLSADLAEFMRQQLLTNGISFTFETVMSHEGKIDFLFQARQKGFRVYLYYVATEDPDININRVQLRVAQDGHHVTPDAIRNRYYKSLSNLKSAVKQTDRAYIFDNSGVQAKIIAEINEGSIVNLNDAIEVPNWVVQYLLKTTN